MITEDLSIYFDLNGFGSTHNLNGTAGVVCVVGERVTGRSELDGTWVEEFEVSCKAADITAPTKRQRFTFDGTSYTVDRVQNDGAVLIITLSNARAGEMVRDMMGIL